MIGRPVVLYAVVVAVCAGLDQWIKSLVVANMDLYDRVDLMPFLSLFHTRNTGVAFSFLSGFNDTFMVILTAFVMLFIGWLAARTGPHQYLARLGFALILGGALGNIIDRALLGYVVDYVLFHTRTWSFAVFNLADAFITVGAGLVVLEEFLAWRRERRHTAPGQDGDG